MGDAHTLTGRRTGRAAALLRLCTLTGLSTALSAALVLPVGTGPAAADSFGNRSTVGSVSSTPRGLFSAPTEALAADATRRASPAATSIGYALAMLGRPYRYGAASPEIGFDCSGLAMRAYSYAGVKLPRTAAQQFAALPPLPIEQARPGDLMFWARDAAKPESIYHVSIFVGGGMVISAPSTGSTVRLKPMGRRNLLPFVVRPAGEAAPGVLPLTATSSGWAIVSLQQRLRNNGQAVPVTGVFDTETRTALTRLQLGSAALNAPGSEVDARAWEWLVSHGELARAW